VDSQNIRWETSCQQVPAHGIQRHTMGSLAFSIVLALRA
jgi:hypothetical protein